VAEVIFEITLQIRGKRTPRSAYVCDELHDRIERAVKDANLDDELPKSIESIELVGPGHVASTAPKQAPRPKMRKIDE
jgi:hypothetical protein